MKTQATLTLKGVTPMSAPNGRQFSITHLAEAFTATVHGQTMHGTIVHEAVWGCNTPIPSVGSVLDCTIEVQSRESKNAPGRFFPHLRVVAAVPAEAPADATADADEVIR